MTAAAFFWSMGLALVLYGVWRWWRVAQMSAWPKVAGSIEELREEKRSHTEAGMTGHYYVPKLDVSYEVAGVRYRTARFSVHNFTIGLPGEIRELLKNPDQGSPIAVSYDPTAPERSIVSVPSQAGAGIALFLGGTIIALTALIAWS